MPETPVDLDRRARFVSAFQQLNDGHPPYPWQIALFERFCSDQPLPDALDIPTGLGKTSVIPIWLLAHALGDSNRRPPMRLVYVVNRRTIVDQATTIAEELVARPQIKLLSDLGAIAVSTLRGAKADNRKWMECPHRPAIVVGTVDMIGSRLLFNAYRAGRWQRSRHAGLIGHDALIVHDEAHLTGPFQKLLEWVATQQRHGSSQHPLRVMAMSATGGNTDPARILTIDNEDRALEAVAKRLNATKRLRIQPAVPARELPARLATLAYTHDAERSRAIVFVRSPELASKVRDHLVRKLSVAGGRVALLTGTLRGHERDELIDEPVLKHLLESTTPDATEYLISTSAGEVGADFDGTHLVCDAAAIDSMIQRLGRVNRRGTGDANVDLVADVEPSARLAPHEVPIPKAIAWLSKLPVNDDGTYRASPQALRDLREADPKGYAEACSPEPAWIPPHDVTLDAWSLTSVEPGAWPLAQNVEPFLHGLDRADPPRVTFAWRAELDVLITAMSPKDQRGDFEPTKELASEVADFVRKHRLLTAETLQAKPEEAVAALAAAGTRWLTMTPETRATRPAARFALVLPQRSEPRWLRLDAIDSERNLDEQLRNATVILPPSAGGMNEGGMPDPDAAGSVPDVADVRADPKRVRWFRPAGADRGYLLGDGAVNRGATRDELYDLGYRVALKLAGPISEGDEAPALLVSYRHLGDQLKRDDRVFLLSDHTKQVCEAIQGIAHDLHGEAIQLAFASAAESHDIGKDCTLWQEAAGNAGGAHPVAKSVGKNGLNARKLNGYRHEYGSLVAAAKRSDISVDSDLTLHLIATHHGRGRPHFEPKALAHRSTINDPEHPLAPAEIARRFARLQRKHGHWGLAWIEACFMAADAEGSQSPEDVDDEADEGGVP